MWDQQPTEPTLVGGPVGHAEGSFNQIWGSGDNATATPTTATTPNILKGSATSDAGWGGANLSSTQQSWNNGGGNISKAQPKNVGGNWGDQNSPVVGNEWQSGGAQNPQAMATGGWGGQSAQPSATNANWNNSSNSTQWTGTSPSGLGGGASSWSQVASKNVPPTVMPLVHPAAVRPKTSAPYDNGTNNWGSNVVDQGAKPADWNGTTSWDRSGKQAITSSWNNPVAIVGNKEKADIQFYPANDRHLSSSHWNGGANTGNSWDAPQQNVGRSAHASWSAGEQHHTPSNVWTGPPSSQDANLDNSMVWNNPYPKKTVQPDKVSGTNAWGDPSVQASAEIKRWKTSSDEQGVTSPLTTPGSAVSSVWNDSPMAPVSQQGSTFTSSSPTNAPTVLDQSSSVSSQMWDQSNGGSTAKISLVASGWGAADSGWNSSKPNESNRQSSGNMSAGGLDADNISSDDVFSSNPTTPQTPLKNGTNSNFPANYPLVAQQLQQPAGKPMQDQQQLQILTKQISDQLKTAVQAGLLDINILNHPLPQETLHRLNQLLKIVPKLEQAQLEMQQFRTTLLLRNRLPMNATHVQEYKRLQDDVQLYTSEIETIQKQITSKTRQSTDNGSSSVMDSLNQSKLFQWKNASSSECDDKKLNVSSSAPNLENMESNVSSMSLGGGSPVSVNDPWTNKRHSGSDWPITDSNKNENLKDNQTNNSHDSNSLDGSESFNVHSGRNAANSVLNVSPLDDGPPEFHPGQRWEWRDPSKIAEDPTATPGSIKPSVLNKLSLDASFMNSMSSAFPNFALQTSLYGTSTPPKLNYDAKPSTMSPSFSSDAYNMNQRHSRPPSQVGQPFGRPPVNKPFNAPNAFVPYGNYMAQWIVLSNLNQFDEHTVQMLVNRFGTTSTLISPPGTGMAFMKFRDASYERLLPIMQKDLVPLGVSVQIMKDVDVDHLLKLLNGRPPQYGTMFAPPHSGLLFDAPPPPPPGAWAHSGAGGASHYSYGLPMSD